MKSQKIEVGSQKLNPPIPPLLKEGQGGLLNEKGLALVMVLVLSVIALAVMAGLIYVVTTGIQTSGLQKRYKTALEAGKGGADVAYGIIGARSKVAIPSLPITYSQDLCLNAKLSLGTSAANWAPCASINKATSMTIDPADPATYDMRFDLGPDPLIDPTGIYRYRVFAKIVDTVEGNTSPDSGWIQGGVVWSKSEVYPMPRPYYYTLEVDVEKQDQSTPERAKLSILYQH
jgi:hypothetical protein